MKPDEFLAPVPRAELSESDRGLYDAVKDVRGAVIGGSPALDVEDFRSQLVLLPGTPIDIGKGAEQVADIVGQADEFVASVLDLMPGRGIHDDNNFACMLLRLDNGAGWLQAETILNGLTQKESLDPELRATLWSNLATARRILMVAAARAAAVRTDG